MRQAFPKENNVRLDQTATLADFALGCTRCTGRVQGFCGTPSDLTFENTLAQELLCILMVTIDALPGAERAMCLDKQALRDAGGALQRVDVLCVEASENALLLEQQRGAPAWA